MDVGRIPNRSGDVFWTDRGSYMEKDKKMTRAIEALDFIMQELIDRKLLYPKLVEMDRIVREILNKQDTSYTEEVLEDDYPVFKGYLYVADGKAICSPIQGTVADLREALNDMKIDAKEITSCDITERGLENFTV